MCQSNIVQQIERPAISADYAAPQSSNDPAATEILPTLLTCNPRHAFADNIGRRERRCTTAPSKVFAAAAAVVPVAPDAVIERGCLPFGFLGLGLSKRGTKKSATVDFTNQVLLSSDIERRPRSILRQPGQVCSGRRATSRVRFAPTVSVAEVSIVKMKDEKRGKRRKSRQATSCEGLTMSEPPREGVATSEQEHGSEDLELAVSGVRTMSI
mmetsp:Transcript_101297/g.253960  ORF Transcript_101297/g.253960 Transcript_101297/m.253960 type:complete len:212 (-) Transcript_101297:255-890(-)